MNFNGIGIMIRNMFLQNIIKRINMDIQMILIMDNLKKKHSIRINKHDKIQLILSIMKILYSFLH